MSEAKADPQNGEGWRRKIDGESDKRNIRELAKNCVCQDSKAKPFLAFQNSIPNIRLTSNCVLAK
jgi:hypothetical protein